MLLAALALALFTRAPGASGRAPVERYREGAWRLEVRRDAFARTTACHVTRPNASIEHTRLVWRLGPRVDTSAAVWRIDDGEPRRQRLVDLPASVNLANPSDGRIVAALPLLGGARALEVRPTPDARLRRLDLAGLHAALASAARLGWRPALTTAAAPSPSLWADAPPPFHVVRPERSRGAAVFASPHSGRVYPPDLIQASRLTPEALRRSEDAYVDALFAHAPALGAPLICAGYARAYVDLNRAPYDLDPAMFADVLPAFARDGTGRARGGLGSIARIVAEGEEIYRRKLTFAEAESRIGAVHRPFHLALEALLDDTWHRQGACVLVDCHSMPAAAAPGAPDVVLGDRHGRACRSEIMETAQATLRASGLRVVRNAPFAGGYITARHGRPGQGRHALQVELNRGLYLDETTLAPTSGWAALQGAIDELIRAMCALEPAALA